MTLMRRGVLKLATLGVAVSPASFNTARRATQIDGRPPTPSAPDLGTFNVRAFGASGNGTTIDTPAINRAIDAAAAAGGGVVYFPAGTYACYSIRLKDFIALYVDQGVTILAASTPLDGTTAGGYDAAESNAPFEQYQDFGHNHWHNSLIWGEGLRGVAILGGGLIWGKGLSRGHNDAELPREEAPGAGNKAIALKNCRNVILRDVTILAAGHFGILATGVDTLTIDNVKIDTNRDGINIDCCRNVHIANCTINSPWDDGICLKSSFALGSPRATENVTIANCYVTGQYRLGSLLDGRFERFGSDFDTPFWGRTGRIKFGTESVGSFSNIAVSNCIFDSCRGLALETVDGASLTDITVTGLAMRDIRNAPFFLRLGARMRGPNGRPPGTLKRILISNVTCSAPLADMPSILCGIAGSPIEDIRISDVYILQKGGGTAGENEHEPPERDADYPEPVRFGPLPAQYFFIRHARNVELSNVELATTTPDRRPAFWLEDVDGADFFRLKLPRDRSGPAFLLQTVKDFRVAAARGVPDVTSDQVSHRQI
jgi:polygalacturonase